MADINFEDIQPFVEGQGDTGKTAREKINRNFAKVSEKLHDATSDIADLKENVSDNSYDLRDIKEALLKSSSQNVERYANIEIGGINGNYNQDAPSVGAIRSINSFLVTDGRVVVTPKSKSGRYYPKVSVYNGCDANGVATPLISGSESKYSNNEILTNANVGIYVRFLLYVYSDAAKTERITELTEDILADIYVSNKDCVGITFDNSNSIAVDVVENEYYNVSEIYDKTQENTSKIEDIENGELEKIPSLISERLTIPSAQGGYFEPSGNVAENQTGYTRGISAYIDVSNYASITILSGIGGSGLYKVGAVLYDKDKHIIVNGIIVGTSSDGILSAGTVIDVSNAKYIRLGLTDLATNGIVDAILTTKVKTEVELLVAANLPPRVTVLEDKTKDVQSQSPEITNIYSEDEGYLNPDGTIHANTTGQRGVSDYISTSGIWKIITVSGIWAAGGNNRPFIYFYNQFKTPISTPESCIATGSADGRTILATDFPEGTAYMRICIADFNANGVVELYGYKSIHEKVAELSANENNINNRFLVIGSSSIQRLENNVGEAYKLYTLLGISRNSVVMSGVGGEDIKAITARLGSEMLTNLNQFTIPSDTTTTVNLGLKNDGVLQVRGVGVKFMNQNGGSMSQLNPVYIDGVKCSITISNDAYILTRLEESENASSHTVMADTQIFPQNIYRRDHILITALGYNGGYDGLSDYLDYHEKALMFCESKKFIFMGKLFGTNWGATNDMLAEESAMRLRYGYNYFNVRKFLVERGVEYARKMSLYDESNATQDAQDMSNGLVPTSLRGDGVHLSNDGYKIVNYRLAEIIKYFNWA